MVGVVVTRLVYRQSPESPPERVLDPPVRAEQFEQVVAPVEAFQPPPPGAGGYDRVPQRDAVHEGVILDPPDALGQLEGEHPRARVEEMPADDRHGGGHPHAPEPAIRERRVADVLEALRQSPQPPGPEEGDERRPPEGIGFYGPDRLRYAAPPQGRAVVERAPPDRRHAVGDVDFVQRPAARERLVAHDVDRLGDVRPRLEPQPDATAERPPPYLAQSVAQFQFLEIREHRECFGGDDPHRRIDADAGHSRRDDDSCPPRSSHHVGVVDEHGLFHNIIY